MDDLSSRDTRSRSADVTTPASTEMRVTGTTHCWECLRRRIVCDMLQPVCKRCHVAGIVCPGYDDKKPLTWLAPGKVVSRPRNRKSPPTGRKGAKPKQAVAEKPRPRTVLQASMDMAQVPRAPELSDGMREIFEAAYYYNKHVFPDFVNNKLVATTLVQPFRVDPLPTMSQRHILITVALSHRMFQLPGSADRILTSKLSSRLLHHRGLAIRALNDELATEDGQCSDNTLSSILIFMFSDVQQVVSGNWRAHASGVERIFELRGGIRQMIQEKEELRVVAIVFIVPAIMGNTTTPAAGQITANTQSDTLDLFTELCEDFYFPVFPCPFSLMIEIIKINDLRYRFAAAPVTISFADDVCEASALLERVIAFSPEEWIKSKESFHDDWLIMARGCQSAVLLYCVLSLRPLLGTKPILTRQHYTWLIQDLRVAMSRPRLCKCMMWPLVVAGVQAVSGNQEEREWIGEELEKMSRAMGSYSPLVARAVLEKFWFSGKEGWDDCFEEPLIFIS